jgi:hypothetical protein
MARAKTISGRLLAMSVAFVMALGIMALSVGAAGYTSPDYTQALYFYSITSGNPAPHAQGLIKGYDITEEVDEDDNDVLTATIYFQEDIIPPPYADYLAVDVTGVYINGVAVDLTDLEVLYGRGAGVITIEDITPYIVTDDTSADYGKAVITITLDFYYPDGDHPGGGTFILKLNNVTPL